MGHLLLLISSLFLLLTLSVACGGDTPENAFPKTIPVDKRAQKEQLEALSTTDVVTKDWKNERESIEALLEGNSRYYQTVAGTDEFTMEYTTYYLEEKKITPIKTHYIYSTGSFDLIYWLPKGQIWLERDGYDFLIDGDKIVTTMRDGAISKATSIEQEKALKTASKAREMIAPINYTL